VHITEDAEGEPLNVGRRTRSIPPAIMRALRVRDKGCRFPGCTCTRFVDGHHIQHWADGGETRLSNLVLLCRHHHRLVHEGGFRVEILDDGALRFVQPDGRSLPVSGERLVPVLWQQLTDQNRTLGLEIDAETGITRWGGERMDYDIGIDYLMRRDGLWPPRVSAEILQGIATGAATAKSG
jgi:hypothetical protein